MCQPLAFGWSAAAAALLVSELAGSSNKCWFHGLYSLSATADAVLEFVDSLNIKATTAVTGSKVPPQWITSGVGVVGISAVVASLADWLPAF